MGEGGSVAGDDLGCGDTSSRGGGARQMAAGLVIWDSGTILVANYSALSNVGSTGREDARHSRQAG